MENKYKYLIYFEGKPVHFNITTKKIVIYKDDFSFQDKQFNTNKVKKHIKDYVLENGALYATE